VDRRRRAWRAADRFPLPQGTPIVARGSGSLAFSPADATSGGLIAAGPAANAVNVPIPAPARRTDVVGEPALELRYSGTSVQPGAYVFAQILDQTRGVVLGNQATPIPLALDGQPHPISRTLEGVAASASSGSKYVLQITGGTTMYGPVRTAGTVGLLAITLTLPAAAAGSSSAAPPRGTAAGCISTRTFRIKLSRKFERARVYVAGKRVKVRRRHGRLTARIDLRGRPARRVKVRVAGRAMSGTSGSASTATAPAATKTSDVFVVSAAMAAPEASRGDARQRAAAGAASGNGVPVSRSEASHSAAAVSGSLAAAERPTSVGCPRPSWKPSGPT
jgi:ABC-2 type transport system ATP-binding protein